jgi:hypothetical protein
VFFKSTPVDEYHLPQMNTEKVFLGALFTVKIAILSVFFSELAYVFRSGFN